MSFMLAGAAVSAVGGLLQSSQNKKVAEEQRKLQAQALAAYTNALNERGALNAQALQQLQKVRGLALDANTKAQGAINASTINAGRATQKASTMAVDNIRGRMSRTGLGGSTAMAQLQQRAAVDVADRTSGQQAYAGRALAQVLSQRAGIQQQTGGAIANQLNLQGQNAFQGGAGMADLLGQFQPVADQGLATSFGQIGGALGSYGLMQQYLDGRNKP